ncbi:FAD-binding oxidoreductase [Nocardioides sp. CFH 31398]|uniref:FAD-binding oxidoreductase n=1 Tax=Nocardioides sp. CFH 31398 TaxID=2919579 RepID=UPI001F058282|nr:FAD-binding oxidoreductase [Nocardioides sp. CFH 31398]MCH1868802.1 FAD-binding oxidoreductase [Nocardioides sp. CFH 31398]
MSRQPLAGWGRTSPSTADVRAVGSTDDVARQVAGHVADRVPGAGRGVLARGLGRSYGDAAQNGGGVVLDMTGLAEVHAVDPGTRLVDVDAGVSLERLIDVLLPRGLWVPVLPGTRQVTVGGAIAADVHGKNHHVHGSFGDHVTSMELVLADGSVRTLRRGTTDPEEAALRRATVGGMGLTGVVTRATIECRRVATSSMVVDTERAGDLDELLAVLATDEDRYPYSVAWFDAVATGGAAGRAVITRGRHAERDELPAASRARPLAYTPGVRAAVPDAVPPGVLNRATARAFNALYYRAAPRRRRTEVQDLTTFFHPLDAITSWNRLYGPRGMVQYQLVVPLGAEDVVRRVVADVAASGHVSCLNVLKRFGPGNDSPLSFPTEGWTLAVDLPVRAGLGHLLRGLDEQVLDAGGRLYLAKDSRADSATLRRMYPRLDEFRATRRRVDPDGVFVSDLARRLEL